MQALSTMMLIVLACYSVNGYGELTNPNTTKSNDKYNQLLHEALLEINKQSQIEIFEKSSIKNIYIKIKIAVASGDLIDALSLFMSYKDVIYNRINSQYSINIFNLLLTNNANSFAILFYEDNKDDFNPESLSKLNYYLAVYHHNNGDWKLSQYHLTQISNQEALNIKQREYATLLFGISLQEDNQHRVAITYYDKIEPDSDYYLYASLNKATALIKQGWWTDAQLTIESAVAHNPHAVSKHLINRLHLVLGYSQLRHEFYKNARNSFRRISLDSEYKNRALLGIGLCALHQGDFNGAINSFTTLKSSDHTDISTTESYLLSAYTYEQLNEIPIALDYYKEAINYYKKRLEFINTKYSSDMPLANSNLHKNISDRVIFINELQRRVSLLQKNKTTTQLDEGLKDINRRYTEQLQVLNKESLEISTQSLNSYLSQSQFSQAKILDTYQ